VKRYLTIVVVLSAALAALHAQERRPPQPPPEKPPAAESQDRQPAPAPAGGERFPAPPAVERLSTTHHTINVRGKSIAYTATAGTLVLRKEDEKPLASMFFISYTLDGVSDLRARPVTFAFNGGPGSSSVWLHMGAFGPKRVAMPPDGVQPAPPYQLVDNEDTLLPFTDLVFIDPVTTGFSRHAPGENPAQFHSVEGDLESVANFIHLYLTRFDRWASPKFLAGESYGTTRAAGLSELLLREHGIYLNGITLVSAILNFETARFQVGNDLPYILFLPTYTATAWYHKKLPADLGDLEKAVTEARRFARNEYSVALMKGSGISAQERAAVAKQLARLTGLSQSYVEHSNLRIPIYRFTKELLRDQRRTVGRYDSRLEGIDIDAAGERAEYDPSYAAVQGAFTAMFNQYVQMELKYQRDTPYEILTRKVQPWSYGRYQNQYLNVAENLRQAMTQNPNLHVLVANGYYDLATPFFATEYTVDHMSLDPTLANHITLMYCDAGHMLYTKQSCRDRLYNTMASFYQAALQ
jgi:carboxypeptidase C (cathepsin A)